MLGTTHFVNACVQCKGLSKVAVIRLCGTATTALQPFCSLPERLCQATGRMAFPVAGKLVRNSLLICDMQRITQRRPRQFLQITMYVICQCAVGGYEYDGGQKIAELDETEINSAVHSALEAGVQAFVICGVFAPVNQVQEEEAAAIVSRAVAQFAGTAVPCKCPNLHPVGCSSIAIIRHCAQVIPC